MLLIGHSYWDLRKNTKYIKNKKKLIEERKAGGENGRDSDESPHKSKKYSAVEQKYAT